MNCFTEAKIFTPSQTVHRVLNINTEQLEQSYININFLFRDYWCNHSTMVKKNGALFHLLIKNI